MNIILIGNYSPDKQESMERFSQMLANGFESAHIKTEIWRPIAFFGVMFQSTTSGIGKWMGYIDKWIIFPFILKWRLLNKRSTQSSVRFHICDHSNAPYLSYLPSDSTVITCHDVLAIRGALGYADAFCPASGMGKLLQQWILHHLSSAKQLASVSQFTFKQLTALSTDQEGCNKNWCIIPNAFNADFTPMDVKRRRQLLEKAGLNPKNSFLLHVGSDLPRKNRKLLLDMVAALENQWNGYIYFAGQPIEEALLAYASQLSLQDRIVSLVKPDHELLVALYSSCEAFIFPSFSEGFGWPVIEAQACGAPVIASNIEPMPEVSGGAALHADPYNPLEFANAFLNLRDENTRKDIIQMGYQNIQRYNTTKIITAYLELHQVNRYKLDAN